MNSKNMINLDNCTIMVTGAAGFIGYHLIRRLLRDCRGAVIVGIDDFNDYYDVALKEWRNKELTAASKESDCRWEPVRGSIADKEMVKRVMEEYSPAVVVNLAAQAGVRYSLENPDAYVNANLVGFYNILEGCRGSYSNGGGVEHLVFASSSSVYGGNTKLPFSEDDPVDRPVSLYAATKKSNELLAHAYAKLYGIPATGLRFFTVYGPAGRPDMAYYSFAEKLRRKEKIQIFNYGNCKRDFTYIDDIVEGIIRVMRGAPKRSEAGNGNTEAPYSVYNIGNSKPENLMEFVHILAEELIGENVLDASFIVDDYLDLVAMQPGDVPATYADTSRLERDYGFKPSTGLRAGLRQFAKWYGEYIKTENGGDIN